MKSWIEKLTETPDGARLLQQEKAILEATELICGILKDRGIARSELASRLDKSRGWVSQLLDGEANMTLRTLADVFTALGYELRLGASAMEQHILAGEHTIPFHCAWSDEEVACWSSWSPTILKSLAG